MDNDERERQERRDIFLLLVIAGGAVLFSALMAAGIVLWARPE